VKIFENNNIYSAFPDPDLFLKSEKEKEFLVPIGLISKDYFDFQIDHDILIAIPIEAVDGLIGESTEAHHTETCRENWLSYSLVNGCWELDCDVDYFLGNDMSEDWIKEPYDQSRKFYSSAKEYFNEHKNLILLSSNDAQPHKQSLIDLGGDAFAMGNWFSFIGEMPHKVVKKMAKIDPKQPAELCETVVMLNGNEQEYVYLGCVWSYLYINPQSAWVHFFYDRHSKRVLMTFDYS